MYMTFIHSLSNQHIGCVELMVIMVIMQRRWMNNDLCSKLQSSWVYAQDWYTRSYDRPIFSILRNLSIDVCFNFYSHQL